MLVTKALALTGFRVVADAEFFTQVRNLNPREGWGEEEGNVILILFHLRLLQVKGAFDAWKKLSA